MNHPRITFIINSTTYSLCAADTEAMSNIPAADRMQLIALLEALKSQNATSQEAVEKAVHYATRATPAASVSSDSSYVAGQIEQNVKPERLGAGDVDALMVRLAMEENRNKKQGLTKQGIYKGLAGFVAVVIFLAIVL